MILAILNNVLKQVLLIGKFMMILKMIEGMFEDAIIDAILILVGLVALLPLEVDEELLAIRGLDPLCASGQYTAD